MTDAIELGFAEAITPMTEAMYPSEHLQKVLDTTLAYMDQRNAQGVDFAYFLDNQNYWHKPKTLSIYITDETQGRTLNHEARGKDYATNVLSYPSDLPAEILSIMPSIELGELILCHEVLQREALEQNKEFAAHLTHLLVHGILHLLGFDHEISQMDADQMESFEIEILAQLGFDNPYQES